MTAAPLSRLSQALLGPVESGFIPTVLPLPSRNGPHVLRPSGAATQRKPRPPQGTAPDGPTRRGGQRAKIYDQRVPSWFPRTVPLLPSMGVNPGTRDHHQGVVEGRAGANKLVRTGSTPPRTWEVSLLFFRWLGPPPRPSGTMNGLAPIPSIPGERAQWGVWRHVLHASQDLPVC